MGAFRTSLGIVDELMVMVIANDEAKASYKLSGPKDQIIGVSSDWDAGDDEGQMAALTQQVLGVVRRASDASDASAERARL